MQIGLNIASTAPAAVISGPSQGTLGASQSSLGASQSVLGASQSALGSDNQNSSANVNDVIGVNQFASLIAPSVKPGTALPALDNSKQLTQGVTAQTPPANNGIAIPLYIDQPIVANAPKLADNVVALNTANNKQRIFSAALPTSGKTLAAASEVADQKLDTQLDNKLQPASNNNIATAGGGKIQLNSLAQNQQQIQDPAFAQAVANIVNNTPAKTLKPGEQDVVQKLPPATAATNNNNQVATNQTASATDGQQQLAAKDDTATAVTKIIAKVVSIKNEKIDGDDSDEANSPTATVGLTDFASQLKTKSFSNIQTAHEALAPTAADQVKVQISQAVASGNNTVKITLHPVELGMVKVDLDTDHEGNTKVSITADKADTLAILKTDSHNLTKSLADAGIKTDASTMQFNLRGDSQNQQQQQAASNQNFQQNNNANAQAQQASNLVGAKTAYTPLNEQTLTLTANKGLNILV